MEFQFYGKRSKTSQQCTVAAPQIDHCRSSAEVRAHQLHTTPMKFHRHEALGGDFTIASRYLRFRKGFAHTLGARASGSQERARPNVEHPETPEPLGVIATAVLMLVQQTADMPGIYIGT